MLKVGFAQNLVNKGFCVMRLGHLTMWMRIPRLVPGFFIHVIRDLGPTESVSLSLEGSLVKGRRSGLVLSECLVKLGLFIEN